MRVNLRDAVDDDIPSMVRLDEAAFPLDPWSPSMLAGEVKSQHTRYVVVEDTSTGEILAAAGVMALQGGGEADVQTIAVDERLRRGGWATRMLAELFAWAESRGAKQVFLEVRENGEAARSCTRASGSRRSGAGPSTTHERVWMRS